MVCMVCDDYFFNLDVLKIVQSYVGSEILPWKETFRDDDESGFVIHSSFNLTKRHINGKLRNNLVVDCCR